MTNDIDRDETRRNVAILQAARLGLELPDGALAGVVANLELLADHHGVLRHAFDRPDAA